jgi:septin family protein
MVVGETGSGKTTLINSMANYHFGVNFRDKFRYILVDDHNKNQKLSVTSEVKEYFLPAANGNPPLIIIDTPGFADTTQG